jgi:hypothetical protein
MGIDLKDFYLNHPTSQRNTSAFPLSFPKFIIAYNLHQVRPVDSSTLKWSRHVVSHKLAESPTTPSSNNSQSLTTTQAGLTTDYSAHYQLHHVRPRR